MNKLIENLYPYFVYFKNNNMFFLKHVKALDDFLKRKNIKSIFFSRNEKLKCNEIAKTLHSYRRDWNNDERIVYSGLKSNVASINMHTGIDTALKDNLKSNIFSIPAFDEIKEEQVFSLKECFDMVLDSGSEYLIYPILITEQRKRVDKLYKKGIKVFPYGCEKSLRLETDRNYAKKVCNDKNLKIPEYFLINNKKEIPKYKDKVVIKSNYSTMISISNMEEVRNIKESFFPLSVEKYIEGVELNFSYLVTTVNGVKIEPILTVFDFVRLFPDNIGPRYSNTATFHTTELPPIAFEIGEKLKSFFEDKTYIGWMDVSAIFDGEDYYIFEFMMRLGNSNMATILHQLKTKITFIVDELYCGRIPKIKWDAKYSSGVELFKLNSGTNSYKNHNNHFITIKNSKDWWFDPISSYFDLLSKKVVPHNERVGVCTVIENDISQLLIKMNNCIEHHVFPECAYNITPIIEIEKTLDFVFKERITNV